MEATKEAAEVLVVLCQQVSVHTHELEVATVVPVEMLDVSAKLKVSPVVVV